MWYFGMSLLALNIKQSIYFSLTIVGDSGFLCGISILMLLRNDPTIFSLLC